MVTAKTSIVVLVGRVGGIRHSGRCRPRRLCTITGSRVVIAVIIWARWISTIVIKATVAIWIGWCRRIVIAIWPAINPYHIGVLRLWVAGYLCQLSGIIFTNSCAVITATG